MAKRSALLLLAIGLVMSLFLSACGGNNGGSANGSANSNAGKGAEGAAGEGTAEPSNEATETVAGEKIELDFWTFWGSETRRPIIEKIIDDFNKSQDRIIVKHTYLPWGDIWTKNLASIAAGNPPDVIVNDINTVATRAKNRQVVSLKPYLDKENIQDRFFPELWNTVMYEDQAYALPFNTDTRMLFYNKDHFAEAGLDPENPPATWAELEEAAKKLDKKNGSRYERIGFYPTWGDFGWDSWVMNADGGTGFLDMEGNVTIDTEKKAAAINWINGWTERLGEDTVNAYKAEFGSQQADAFVSGKVSMMTRTATFYTQLRDYGPDVNFGIAPIPAYEEGSGNYSAGGGFVVEIPYGAKNPDASWEFINYLTDVQAQQYWAVKNFDNVANKEAADQAAQSPELDETGKMVYAKAVENLQNTKLFPTPAFAPDYRNLVNPQVDAALLGDTTAEKALAQAQKDVEKLIQSNQ
ncbi:ABC transporter substrate-binding protein [uncultured Paenibacillus sp.]|uniref:ABC transporter substrate-binding protein n=1 Tax=uncultured Paenibacillus sp. TaxID=227322 RepID=UPI0028D6DA2F|nr:ABC transporter substrate-binding protein [uncultured Paenibacillus sp.]